ncbi:hypothetical protein CE91St41_27830 [Oscillospiraceae bacterium]|nr:hypothetical protein CE91St40_09710 [Oscillospiraceae bacterium]BDF75894.1 hypothetical protein CE91St41_27830 [Oscillospiraceae bacterium]
MRISKLSPSTKVKGRWLVCLEDGSMLRVGENQVADFSLYAGMELDARALEALREAAGTAALREKALNCLSVRPLSRRELVKKLSAPGKAAGGEAFDAQAAQATAEAVADWLEELGYLNDGEYAKTLARHYAAKGCGERKIRDELYRRGVPRTYWDSALEEAEGPEEAIDAFLRKKLAGREPDRKELKRAADALARRGYRWDEISAGLRRYGAEAPED